MFATISSGRWIPALVLIAALAGCSGSQPGNGALPETPGGSGNIAPAQPDGGTTMYVASFASNAILGFPSTAHGNTPPTVKIAGSKTQLDGPAGLAVAPSGKLYVANGGYHDSRILIFPSGANGNVAPQIIAGSNVPIASCEGLAVDSSGKLYVSDYINKAIYVFAAGASGNVAPIRTIAGSATKLVQPFGMSFDAAGDLYVANSHTAQTPVEEFAPGANGNVAPIATLGGSHTKMLGIFNMVLDPKGRIIVQDGGSILVFGAGAHGNVKPKAVISGPATKMIDVTSVGTDAQGNIYGTSTDISHGAATSILVFASDAKGNAAPLRVLAGSQTQLIDVFYPSFL